MKSQMLEVLYSAVNSRYGVVVETEDAEHLRQKLYALRREYEADFKHLSFVISPINGSDLWIVNKEHLDGQE